MKIHPEALAGRDSAEGAARAAVRVEVAGSTIESWRLLEHRRGENADREVVEEWRKR